MIVLAKELLGDIFIPLLMLKCQQLLAFNIYETDKFEFSMKKIKV